MHSILAGKPPWTGSTLDPARLRDGGTIAERLVAWGLLVLALLCPTAVAAERRLSQAVSPRPEVAGAPQPSDVCMRSLRPRPVNPADPHDTLEAIRRFHVTWLEWTYGDDREFIRQVHALGAVYGGALAAGSYRGDVPRTEWNTVDREGALLVAPWMRQWKRPNAWGCANHPEFRAGHLRAAVAAVEAGADVLQRDEPRQNMLAFRWGGCFCDFCRIGFRDWLAEHADPEVLARLGVTDLDAFDYRDYLRQQDSPVGDAFANWPGDPLKTYFERFQADSTAAFHVWWRDQLNRQVGRTVPVSCNNGVRHWDAVEQLFDYCIGELSATAAQPEFLVRAMERAVELGKTQSVTMPLRRGGPRETDDWVRHTRQTIATVYALGGHIEMPWDTYLPTPDAERYFGRPENYADLTAQVRGLARFLDDYSGAFVTGCSVQDMDWPGDAPPLRLLDTEDGVLASVRAVADDLAAPLVIHLIDWRDQPQPFSLSVRPQAFFGSAPLHFRLFTPVEPYEAAAHDRAFRTGDYQPLVRERELARGFESTLRVPALTPWGVLVVQPESPDAPGVWSPSFQSDDATFYEEVQVRLESASPGAVIHYTLDGSPPTADSPRYDAPLRLTESRTVRAISRLAGASSTEVSARFQQRPRPENLLQNGQFDDGMTGWNRVVASPLPRDALVWSQDTTGRLSGPNSMRLQIRQPTGTVYHLRLTQGFQASADSEYRLSFRAVADGPVRCRVGLQALRAPHRVLGMRMETIDTTARRYTLTASGPPENEAVDYLVQFDLGARENQGRTVWIDDVQLSRVR